MSCLVFCFRCKYYNEIPAYPLEANIRLVFDVPSHCLVCNEQCHFTWKESSEDIFSINILEFDNYLSSYEVENENINFIDFIAHILQASLYKQLYEDILTVGGFLSETESENDLETIEQRNEFNTRNESEPINQATNSLAEVQRENSIEKCSICLEEYRNEEDVVKIRCNHVFHKPCLSKWEEKGNNTCPICRICYVFKRNNLLVILSKRIGVKLN
jgi:hypothetical protein